MDLCIDQRFQFWDLVCFELETVMSAEGTFRHFFAWTTWPFRENVQECQFVDFFNFLIFSVFLIIRPIV